MPTVDLFSWYDKRYLLGAGLSVSWINDTQLSLSFSGAYEANLILKLEYAITSVLQH